MDTASGKYRSDIDGLRAVAVLAVVAFHAFPEWLPGGFVGVDVFFAISGYLITGLILDHLKDGSFSFRGFYARRVRRIFPALMLVLAASLVLGWLLLLPAEFANLGKHALGAAGFVSNFVLWTEAGYFDAGAIEKPLLHLWSLGVEEQFYLIWPPLLWMLWKFRSVFWALALLTALSLALCIWLTAEDPVAAFYAPYSRMWELSAGGLLACLQRRGKLLISNPKWASLLALIGFVCLGVGFALTREERGFPGWWALLPVCGTLLLIVAGSASGLVRGLLANRLAVGIGLISYPLYLWHWVLLSFAHFALDEPASVLERCGVVLLSIALATATYLIVERPIRRARPTPLRVGALVASLGAIAALGAFLVREAGLPGRFPQQARALLTYHYDWQSGGRVGECWIPHVDPADGFDASCLPAEAGDRPQLFIWGDSHAGRLRPGFERAYGDAFAISSATRDSCPPTLVDRRTGNCEEGNHFVLSAIERTKPDIVVMFAVWQMYPNRDAVAVASRVAQAGVRRVIVLGPFPTWEGRLPRLMFAEWRREYSLEAPIPRRMTSGLVQAGIDLDAEMRSYDWPPGVEYVSVRDMLCNAEGCLTYVEGSDVELMTWDYGHMTTEGSALVAQRLHLDPSEFQRALVSPRAP